MKHLLTNVIFNIYRQVFVLRSAIPVAFMLAIVILTLLLPGTVFAGPGSVK